MGKSKGRLIMCGGGGNDGPVYTTTRTDIGLGIIHVQKLIGQRVDKEYVKDSLLRKNWCWNSALYSKKLTEADVDESKLTLKGDGKLAQDARTLIADRREYARREAKKPAVIENKRNNCVIH